MSKPSVVTIRIPNELKSRLEAVAHQQGVSVNQYALYVLTGEVARFEAQEQQTRWRQQTQPYLQDKSADQVLKAGLDILDAVPKGNLPEWDHIDE